MNSPKKMVKNVNVYILLKTASGAHTSYGCGDYRECEQVKPRAALDRGCFMMKNFFKAMDRGIAALEDTGCVISFAAIVGIVVAHVFFRYVLRSGILWSDEVVQILMVSMVMFGTARAVREDGHTELQSFTDRLPSRARTVVRALVTLVSLGFLIMFFVSSLEFTVTTGTLKTVMLRIPRKYCYMFLPLGAGLSIYEFIKTARKRIFHEPKEF